MVNMKDYILVYSGTLFFFVSIYLYFKNLKKISYYIFFLFLTTVTNWNIYTKKLFPIIKKIDKYYVSFLLFIIFKNLILKLSIYTKINENIDFFDLLITGFLIQILILYTISKCCSFFKFKKKAIFHSIMHLNGVCLMLCLSNDYMTIY